MILPANLFRFNMSRTTFEAMNSGKFLTVQWRKNDGTVRTVSARAGVKKYLKGTGKPASDKVKDTYILLWTRDPGGLRFNQPRLIRRDSILAIRAEGFKVESNLRSDYAKMIRA